MRRYFHSGQMGDLIYSLPTVKALGPGVYVTALRKERHDELAPLLRRQHDILAVEHHPVRHRPPVGITHDFDRMRRPEYAPLHTRLLTASHALPFRVKVTSEPWLDADPGWQRGKHDRAIVARSFRYRRLNMDWVRELNYLRERHADLAFVGLENEYKDFLRIDAEIPWIPTADALALAQVIYESRQFSGNQSFPLALAVGYGVPHRIEIAPGHTNCSFPTHEPIP